MKKLIVMFAAAAMAFGAQAAAVDWSTGVFNGPDGSSSKTGSKYSGVYLATITVYSDAAGETELGTASSDSVKKTGVINSTVDVTEPASGTTSTYYTKLVIKDIATGKELESTMGSFTWTGGALTAPSLTFYGPDAGGFASGGAPSASAAGWATPGGGGTPDPGPTPGPGPDPLPEPTSGLLLLIGGAMLALRRKQK